MIALDMIRPNFLLDRGTFRKFKSHVNRSDIICHHFLALNKIYTIMNGNDAKMNDSIDPIFE